MGVEIGSNVKDPDRIRERRRQIVEASVRLFSEQGFHKTTTRQIAKESGLSIGALYEYVTSKEDILFLVCQHIHHEISRQLEMHQSEQASGAMKLQRAIEGLFAVMHQMQADVLLIYQEAKSLPRPYLREVLRQEEQIALRFEHLLQEGVKDKSLSVSTERIPLLAHDIVVTGQMWAFRRWALKDVPFEQFVQVQTRMLMSASGASNTL